MSEEINKAVHGAMGFCWHEGEDSGLLHDPLRCKHCRLRFFDANPDYCTDLNAAFRFAEKLVADGWDWSAGIGLRMAGKPIKFYVVFSEYSLDIVREGAGESLAKAICLAGLAALSITPPDSSR